MRINTLHMNYKSKLFLLMALWLVIVSCERIEKDTVATQRPHDPWVFRSVLDEQPRIVTVALNENMYVAYDAREGGIYKAWKGGVNFDGPVYTTKHGPQPTSKGYAYYEHKLTEPSWVIIKDGGATEKPEFQFRGHEFKDDRVYIKYELKDAKGNVIQITESPEYVQDGKKNGLERVFTTANVPDGEKVGLNLSLTSLEKKDDYKTDGKFTEGNQSTQNYENGSTISIDGVLELKSNDKTSLTTFYHPGFDVTNPETAEKPESEVSESVLTLGKQLIEGSDCKTCHNETKKTIGPAYLSVAEKYETSKGTISELADKVIKGGKGVWGEVLMTPHPDLQKADAERMVTYILSLDNEEPEEEAGEEDLMLGVGSVGLALSEENTELDTKDAAVHDGLAALMYIWHDQSLPFDNIEENTSPVLSGVAPVVHFTDKTGLGTRKDRVMVVFHGYVDIPETSNYVFRLVSDDGSQLFVNDKHIIDNGTTHGTQARDCEVYLQKGLNKIKIQFGQGTGDAALSFQWAKHGDDKFSVVPASVLKHKNEMFKKVVPYVDPGKLMKKIPGDQAVLTAVHPAFDLSQARPDGFQPRVGGMDFLSDGRIVVCTWDSVGPVYIIDNVNSGDPSKMTVKKIASGLAEPLGLKVVDDEIYVLQKQELTKLIDHDGDEIIDEYQTVSDDWRVSANFHEFAFGLVYKDGYFYAALATAIMPGGASANPQIPDRGKVVKISKEDGSLEFIAHGLRTPNGIGIGADGEIFVADNQGDWLPSSKILHVQKGAWFGSRSVDFEGTADLEETLPLVWLPQDEIGNSPSTPSSLNVGPYKNQMIHGEVTHGGVKRVFPELVDGKYQGAVFRFVQGLEAGVNRMVWGPDGDLYIGGIGNPGNWQQNGKFWYGLQRLHYNGNSVFEPLAIRAKSNGIEVEFTEPLAENAGRDVNDYEIKQWYYKPTQDYGGPKLDLEVLKVQSLNISEDRKKVFFELPGMKANHVVHFRIVKPFLSSNNHSLWTTEGWYTMNNIPQDKPGFSNPVKPAANNQLTEKEKEEGWKLLFDGKSTDGWRKFKSDKVPASWKVKNGALVLEKSGDGGDIITNDEYQDFELELEWMISEGGNSGIIYYVKEGDDYGYVWNTGLEMQILDNMRHPDGRFEKHRSGDLYDLIETSFVTVNPPLEWNKVKIISKGGHVEQWQNGYKVVEFDMNSAAYQDLIKNSKFKDMKGFGQAKKGHIALQDHGDKVWFRNIKIKEL